MDLPIRLVNLDTLIPVDDRLASLLKGSLHKAFQDAIVAACGENIIDIFFVKKERIPENEKDKLGCFYRYHPCYHRPLIEISPEKILDETLSLNVNSVEHYEALFIEVFSHELAHLVMCPNLLWNGCYRVEDVFEQNLVTLCRPVPVDDKNIERNLKKYIEESLAESIAIRQKYSNKLCLWVKNWIQSRGSGPYWAGLNWNGRLETILKTAESWRQFKSEAKSGRVGKIYDDVIFPFNLPSGHPILNPLIKIKEKLISDGISAKANIFQIIDKKFKTLLSNITGEFGDHYIKNELCLQTRKPLCIDLTGITSLKGIPERVVGGLYCYKTGVKDPYEYRYIFLIKFCGDFRSGDREVDEIVDECKNDPDKLLYAFNKLKFIRKNPNWS